MFDAMGTIGREVLFFPPMTEGDPRLGTATGDPDEVRLDEAELVRGITQGDDEIVAEFLRRTHGPVYRIASRLTSDPEFRADWSHDTLLGILDDVQRGRFEYRGPGSFWGWFRKRAYYRILDEYRKARVIRERERPSGAGPDFPEFASLDRSTDPFEELERVRLRSALEACLAKITNENHRRSLECLFFRDLSYETIAEELEAPLNTVRAWIRRGRLLLRKCLVNSLDLLDAKSVSDRPAPEGGRS